MRKNLWIKWELKEDLHEVARDFWEISIDVNNFQTFYNVSTNFEEFSKNKKFCITLKTWRDFQIF